MTQKLTFDEKKAICERLAKYGPVFPPAFINFFWTEFIFESTCGMFKPANKIHLRESDKLAILDGAADDVICHELYHAKQYAEQGWLKYSVRNLLRLNEPEAYAEQERVRRMIEEIK